MARKPAADGYAQSLLGVSDRGSQVSTLMIEVNDLLVRLFNAEGDESPKTITLSVQPDQVELDGRIRERLAVRNGADGRSEVQVAIPRFDFCTLRLYGVGHANH